MFFILFCLSAQREILPESLQMWKLSLSCKDKVSMEAFSGSFGDSKKWTRERSKLFKRHTMYGYSRTYFSVFLRYYGYTRQRCLTELSSDVCTSRQHISLDTVSFLRKLLLQEINIFLICRLRATNTNHRKVFMSLGFFNTIGIYLCNQLLKENSFSYFGQLSCSVCKRETSGDPHFPSPMIFCVTV